MCCALVKSITLCEIFDCIVLQELTVADRASLAYHAAMRTEERQYRADLEKALQADAMVHALHERTYVSLRRESYLALPAMSPHYPNPNYPVPAQLLPGVRFQRPAKTQRNILDIVLGRPLVKSYFALPVGRKPSAEQLREHNDVLINGDAEELQRRIRIVGVDDSDNEDNPDDDAEVGGVSMKSGKKSTGAKVAPAADDGADEDPKGLRKYNVNYVLYILLTHIVID